MENKKKLFGWFITIVMIMTTCGVVLNMVQQQKQVSSAQQKEERVLLQEMGPKRQLEEYLDGKHFQGESFNIGYPLRFNPAIHHLMVKMEKFPVNLKKETGILSFNDSAYNLNLEQAKKQPNPQAEQPPIVYLYVPEYSAYITRIENHFDITNKLDFYLGYVNQQFYMEKDDKLGDHYHFRLANMDELCEQYLGQADYNSTRVYAYSQKSNLTLWNMTYNHNTSSYQFQFAGQHLNPNTSQIVVDDLQVNHLSWLIPYQSTVLHYSHNKHPIYSTVLFNETTLHQKAKLHYILNHYHNLKEHTAFVSSDILSESGPTAQLALEQMTINPDGLPPILPLSWFNRQEHYPPVLELINSPIVTNYNHHYSLYPQLLLLNLTDLHQSYANSLYKQHHYPHVLSLSSSSSSPSSPSAPISSNDAPSSPFQHLLTMCNCTLTAPEVLLTFWTSSSAQFIVDRKTIQSHPLSFYQCLYELYNTHPTHALSIDLTLKDMWLLLFNYDQQFTFTHTQ